MTDNESIKGLRAVAKKYEGKPVATFETNISAMATDAANHIERLCDENNRQKAEKEALIAGQETLQKYIAEQKAEIERLEAGIDKQYEQAKADILGNMADGGTSCHWCIEQHRAVAIKEFAERLKAKFIPSLSFNEDLQKVVTVKDIDNLVKEMVGDD